MLTQAATPAAPVEADPVRSTTPDERREIAQIAIETGVFNDYELGTLDELLDGYFDDPEKSGYHFLSYRENGHVLGFALWGPRALSDKGYDLYWIATRPSGQRRGIGRALMAAVEGLVRARGGYWLVIETSDTPLYAAARGFYERCGYRRAAVLPDFYRDGDGLVICAKRVG